MWRRLLWDGLPALFTPLLQRPLWFWVPGCTAGHLAGGDWRRGGHARRGLRGGVIRILPLLQQGTNFKALIFMYLLILYFPGRKISLVVYTAGHLLGARTTADWNENNLINLNLSDVAKAIFSGQFISPGKVCWLWPLKYCKAVNISSDMMWLHRELDDNQMAHVLSFQPHKLSVLMKTHHASKLLYMATEIKWLAQLFLPQLLPFFLGVKKLEKKKTVLIWMLDATHYNTSVSSQLIITSHSIAVDAWEYETVTRSSK